MRTLIRFRRQLLIAVALLAAVFLIVHFVVRNTYFTIDTGKNGTTDAIIVRHVDTDGNHPQVSPVLGIYMIPRSSDTIIVRQGSSETRKLITSKLPIGFNHLQIGLQPQKQIKKVGQGGLDCNGRTDTARFFSYSCFDASNNVFLFADKAAGQYENQLVRPASETRLSTRPYQNGILSVVQSSGVPSLQYLSAVSGEVNTLGLTVADTGSISLYVSASDTSFVLIDNRDHQMVYYTDLSAAPRKFSINQDIVYSSCDVTKQDIICAATSAEILGNNEEGAHDAANMERIKDSRIIRYAIDTGKQTQYPTERLVDNVCMTPGGVYSLEDDETLYFYPLQSGRQSRISNQVKSISCGGSSVAYTDGISVFVSREGTTDLVFEEKRMKVSNLQVLSQEVVFNTYLNDAPQSTALTYRVTSEALTQRRIESVLPYGLKDNIPVLEMDYDDTNIYIKPQLSITSDRQAGTTIIDEEALAKTKQIIEAKLAADGLLDTHTVVYYYN